MFTYNDEHQQSPKDASSENNKDANILLLLDNQSWNKMVSMLFMFEIRRLFSIFTDLCCNLLLSFLYILSLQSRIQNLNLPDHFTAETELFKISIPGAVAVDSICLSDLVPRLVQPIFKSSLAPIKSGLGGRGDGLRYWIFIQN